MPNPESNSIVMEAPLPAELFSEDVRRAWHDEGIDTLLPIQAEAVRAGCLGGKSCLVIGPTSCGKTFVGEMVCVRHLLAGRRCFYLVPFKALAEEKWSDFCQKYARPQIGARVAISTADRRENDRRISEGDFDVAVLTYEKLSAMMVSHPTVLRQLGALIVDEIQMVCDHDRGAELELLLTRVRQVSPGVQVVGLSAAMSQLRGFDQWCGASVVASDLRPVRLREGVIASSGRYIYEEWGLGERTDGVEDYPALEGSTDEELTVSLCWYLLEGEPEQVLVFANSIKGTLQIARAIARGYASGEPARETKALLSSLETTESVSALLATLDKGVAFHNADLTLDERLAVEHGFRSGEIHCVVATSTLAMGVNLPASTVVISSHEKWSREGGKWGKIPLSVAEYRNMSGRAGRLGIQRDPFGRSVLVASSPIQQQAHFRTYVQGTPAPMKSALLEQPLDVRVLRIIASGLCDSADGLCRFLLKTYGAAQYWPADTDQAELARVVSECMDSLRAASLLESDSRGRLEATEMGRICASSGLLVSTFARLIEYVRDAKVSALDVARIAALSADAGPDAVGLNMGTEEYKQRTAYLIRDLREIAGNTRAPVTGAMLDELAGSVEYDEARRLKYQMVGYAYVTGVASEAIEDRMGASAGKARSIGKNCSWLCDAGASVAWVQGRVEEARELERLSDRFSHGCSEAALLLAQVPHRLHRAEREAIVAAGYTSLTKIVDAPPSEIAKNARVSRARVEGLQKGIITLLGDAIALERRQMQRLTSRGIAADRLEAVYAASGTLLEHGIEDLLSAPFCPLAVARITSQREGEADLRLVLSNGRNGIAQVTAKEKNTDRIGILKAGAVLQQSPELSPSAFICFGRPDFDDAAIRKAQAHADAGTNYKLIPVSVLGEMYVRFHEGRIDSERVRAILEDEVGYMTTDRIGG